jgi:predicted AAA+ superfamily ATPase
MYIKRIIGKHLKQITKQFPVIFLTGPRQSGKTTLLKNELPDYGYVNLEDPDLRQWALDQPRDFLDHHPWPLIIDEVQYVPSLFSYIQLISDEHNKPGMFILSGSQNFLLMEKITQSLAGRSAVLSLLPLSWSELSGLVTTRSLTTDHLIIKGFFPRLYASQNINTSLFYKSFLNTYVEKDVRQLSNIGNLNDYIRFIKLCAGRSGQLLNISSLATEAGIAYNTCKAWLSWLSAGYVIHLLSPHYKNFNKKVVKTPKIYFTDTGLLTHLLGIDSPGTLALHPLRGAVFETLVFNELLKHRLNKLLSPSLWFWRDNHGTEVDFLVESDSRLSAVEAKSGRNFHEEWLSNILRYHSYNPSLQKMILAYDGDIERNIKNVHILNWRKISEMI